LREDIKKRANGLCEEDLRKGLAVTGNCCDHIIPEAEGGQTIPSNLQWLCSDCHDIKTKAEKIRGVRRSAL
jgi:5-methylcytosine-specific restriction protein A